MALVRLPGLHSFMPSAAVPSCPCAGHLKSTACRISAKPVAGLRAGQSGAAGMPSAAGLGRVGHPKRGAWPGMVSG